MRKALYYIILFLLAIQCFRATAQNENKVWCFGEGLGVDFNTIPPTVFHPQMRVLESSSSVCDANGQLLFYTSGGFIWDKNGNFMPNGQNLSGNGPYSPTAQYPYNVGSSSSGVLVVQSPSNPNQYYQFVTDAMEDATYRAYYSVIDMTLNGGLGDVIPTQKNIMFADSIEEGVVGTYGADCHSAWILVRHRLVSNVAAYKLDPSGVHTTPVISGVANTGWGKMFFNKTGSRLGMIFNTSAFDLYGFDKASGALSYTGSLQSGLLTNQGMQFSPDGSKLYIGGAYGVVQFDVSALPNIASVQNTRISISDSLTSAMRTGPDGKIYFTWFVTQWLNCIHQPNVTGAGATVTYHDITVSDSMINPAELGKDVVILPLTDTFVTVKRDTVCKNLSLTLSATRADCTSYQWNTGATTSSIIINNEGVYWVKGIKDCSLYLDTFNLRFKDINIDLGPDTSICKGDALLLNATADNASYYWQDGSTGATYLASQSGTYVVIVTQNNCSKKDSIHIEVTEPSLKIVEPDTIVCKAQSFTLHAIANPESNFQWNTGSTASSLNVTDSGTYVVKAINKCGTYYDSVKIGITECFCNAFVPNAFTPNGDGNNDILLAKLNCPGSSNVVFSIYNRYGQQVFRSNDINTGWDGTQNNKLCELGTYFYYLQYKNRTGEIVKKKGDIILLR